MRKGRQLNRIHLEEDAAKACMIWTRKYLRGLQQGGRAPDRDRDGAGLRSGDEAYAYLTELRKIVTFSGYLRW